MKNLTTTKLFFLILISMFASTLVGLGVQKAFADVGHTVEFLGASYDANENTTTFTYKVTSGTKPSLSHWEMEFCATEDILETSEAYESNPTRRAECLDGLNMIKFDTGYEDGDFRIVTIVLKGYYETTTVKIAFKDGDGWSGCFETTGPLCKEAEPSIDIEKATNGEDADEPTGPALYVGDKVLWTYLVTNTGNVDLTNVVVTDDKLGEICTIELLPAGESKTCEAEGTAEEGQYENLATVTGWYGKTEVSDSDPSHYIAELSPEPCIQIEKYTNDIDTEKEGCPEILIGEKVEWKYVVTNCSSVDLTNVVVTDDKLGEICTIELLPAGESKTCEAEGTAEEGQYENKATVTGWYEKIEVSDEDESCYFGAEPYIDLEKHTNGEDADDPTGPKVPVGDEVKWEYIVTNTGNVTLTDIVVEDDILGEICKIEKLEAGESTTCEATGIAEVGQYENIGKVTGKYEKTTVGDEDPSHYFGEEIDFGCIEGYVYLNGKPLAGAVVRLESPGLKTTKHFTEQNGHYIFKNVVMFREYTLWVQGYPQEKRTFVLDENRYGCITENYNFGGVRELFSWYEGQFSVLNDRLLIEQAGALKAGNVATLAGHSISAVTDEDVWEYHVLLAWTSDIDAFVINWLGPNSNEQIAASGLLRVTERLYQQYSDLGFDFKIIIAYNEATPGDFQENMTFIADSIVSHPAYYGVRNGDRQPLFVFSPSRSLSSTEFTDAAKQYLPSTVDVYWNWDGEPIELDEDVHGVFPWVQASDNLWDPEGKEWGEKYLNEFYTESSSLPIERIVGAIWPGYDERPWFPEGFKYMDRQDTLVYDWTWDQAFNYQPDWLMVESWNSWNRYTHIEVAPGIDYTFVLMTRNKAILWKGGHARAIIDLGFIVPENVYLAHKRGLHPNIIDQALQLFFSGDYNKALALLKIIPPGFTASDGPIPPMTFVDGAATYSGEGWDNAVDGDPEGWDGTTTAMGSSEYGGTYGIFEFANNGIYLFDRIYLQTDNGSADDGKMSQRQANDIEVLVSTSGTAASDFASVLHVSKNWGSMEHYSLNEFVAAKYIKVVLHGPKWSPGGWRQLVEFGVENTTHRLGKAASQTTEVADLPDEMVLEQNYPNPFNPVTTIRYNLANQVPVHLAVYDVNGREIGVLVDETQAAGAYNVTWDARSMASGTYFYKLQAGDFISVKRMILLK